MILTDREIQIAIHSNQVQIDPMPDQDAFSSTSVDLTLGDHFSTWCIPAGMTIAPGARGYKYTDYLSMQKAEVKDRHEIEPQSFVLAWTKEKVRIPIQSRLAARVEGKSSLARLGIGIHVTAPTIHCGFEGQVQLEIFNFGPHTVRLDAGMKICQLIFEQTIGTPNKGYEGMFSKQTSDTLK
jgi:dCTP deaminase